MRLPLAGLFLAAAGPLLVGAGERAPLSDTHRRWLEEEVVHIITGHERQAFLDIAPPERDRFITAFWAARDPTPGTRENEFRDEHYRRIEVANRLFGRRKQPGWKGARGRLLVQLGDPTWRQEYLIEARLHPIEHWFYRSPPGSGLPPHFNVIFFKPAGVGDFQLYDPSGDGPEALMPGLRVREELNEAAGNLSSGDSLAENQVAPQLVFGRDRIQAILELGRVSTELQRAALALIPSDPVDLENGRIHPATSRLAAHLHALEEVLPVDDSYVERVVSGTPQVDVEYSFQHFGMLGHFVGGFLADGGGGVHYVIELPPESLGMQRYRGRTSVSLEIVGRVFDEEREEPVLQIAEEVEVSLSEDQFKKLASSALAVEDLVPLPAGAYRATLVVRNLITREFGVVEGSFDVPRPPATGLGLGATLLSERSLPHAGISPRPFAFAGRAWYPVGDGVAARGAELTAMLQVAYPPDAPPAGGLELRYRIVGGSGKQVGSGSTRVAVDPAHDDGVVVGVLPLTAASELRAGDYAVSLTVIAGDHTAERVLPLTIAAPGSRAAPWLYIIERPAGAPPPLLAAGGEAEDAAETVRRLAEERLREHDYVAVLALLDPVGTAPAPAAYDLLLLGLARSATEDGRGAIEAFERAAEGEPTNTSIWNVLGEEHLRAGQRTEARQALTRSLAIDPAQPKVQELLELIGPG